MEISENLSLVKTMPKYNLYRIPKDKENDLREKLKLSGLEQIGTQDSDGFHMSFFFSSQPDTIDIWWVETYKDFWGDLEILETPKNLMHFGVLLISGNRICYAVSLGKAHFYLSQFCDTEFGLNLAERIIDENDLKMKNSKYYKSAKSKMITTYQQGNPLTFDSGESMHYIKAKTIDPITWGKTVSFGTSVHLNLAKEPLEIASFIHHIEDILQQPLLVKLPKVDIIKDIREIQRLDRFLVGEILRNQEDSGMTIEEFTMSGIDFIFSDNCEYSIYLKGKGNEAIRLNELNLTSLINFLKSHNIKLEDELNNLKIKVHNEYGRNHTKPMKFYLDCIEEEGRCCLIDGVWHKFNQSYVDFLKEEVDKIDFNYVPIFDISHGNTEDQFNKNRVYNGYRNYDKSLASLDGRYKVEKMDLYKDNVLYIVKKGTPQKLAYVIDQAINTVKILQNNADCIEIDNNVVDVTGICLWLILDRKTDVEKISDINSIIFHMKLVEWKKILVDAKFTPLINVNYIR
jgi:uncharacterized protein (TIGR04141 family)